MTSVMVGEWNNGKESPCLSLWLPPPLHTEAPTGTQYIPTAGHRRCPSSMRFPVVPQCGQTAQNQRKGERTQCVAPKHSSRGVWQQIQNVHTSTYPELRPESPDDRRVENVTGGHRAAVPERSVDTGPSSYHPVFADTNGRPPISWGRSSPLIRQ